LPDYSRDKVYLSDIKKVAQWYNILHNLNMLEKEQPEAETKKDADPDKVEETDKKTEKAPAAEKKKKSSPKKKTEQ